MIAFAQKHNYDLNQKNDGQLYAVKSIKQICTQNQDLDQMMATFRQMVNHCIRIGLENNCSTLKKLSMLSYRILQDYEIQSYYKLTAISQACGRLSQMKRDVKKGRRVRSPYVSKPYLVSCYGFKINGMLLSIPTGNRNYTHVLLNEHTLSKLNGVEPRSFTITPTSISITVRKQVREIVPENVMGIDRNLRNVTIFTPAGPIMYKTNKLFSIKENTSYVLASFKRHDVRVKKYYQRRLGNRRSKRISSSCTRYRKTL